jgi:hypothetical protein
MQTPGRVEGARTNDREHSFERGRGVGRPEVLRVSQVAVAPAILARRRRKQVQIGDLRQSHLAWRPSQQAGASLLERSCGGILRQGYGRRK